MSDCSELLLAKLDSLNDSLDDLEERLEPLLAQTLPESLLPLDTIQQVKLNVALPYLVYDLIFIYLKTRGIDPKTHPVVAELDRVRQYFDKIKNAEDPEKRKTTVDKAAANRFIKHAIAQVRAQRPPGDNEGPSHIRFNEDGGAPSPAAAPAAAIPIKVTSKMRARAEYEQQLAEQGSDEDADELEVFEDGEGGAEDEDVPEAKSSKDKGKGRATEATDRIEAASAKKRRRPAVDPFAGYGDNQDTKAAKSPKKKKQVSAATEGDDVAMGDEAVSGSNTPTSTPSSTKKDKSNTKKTKKKPRKSS
ncbi:Nuclear nucleic acid-binding protein C1D [Trametes pubescens]|uniref:Exosome complex protein n=1 Tax=Trametes pubescens TaxID=154538 RepID=A0A1M2VWZ0_TRAPU|nr:Nuclear nucleic acid-binding protein C1D [Trametes pubescens]